MNQPQQQILCIEIKTINEAHLDLSQVQPMTVYFDSASNYYLATGIKQIESAILAAIPRLGAFRVASQAPELNSGEPGGSNYRHPLLFNVQILPGDKIDAQIASVENLRDRMRIRRKTNN